MKSAKNGTRATPWTRLVRISSSQPPGTPLGTGSGDRDEPFVIYHATPARETNCPAARWPLFVAAGQGTVLVHRNIPFYGGHHRPCEWSHCKFFRRPVHPGPGLPTTQGTSCGHPGTNCYCRRRRHSGSSHYDSG
ncbi:hypothetical protein HPB52_016700 [Rhipicephalus sanguineus]|uniref:Uncharacterized protein n=1 Tax=Rhipicephalus sanguineus TaxID=34632 RepID=A0A9D4SYR0_RHISA|nr:hypothetical protein HPB52_016700 [Rhipicephalus sanguineus]